MATELKRQLVQDATTKTVVDSNATKIEGITNALQIVAAAGVGFEVDGTGITLGKAVAGNFSATWADGSTAQRGLLDMPFVYPAMSVARNPLVDQTSQTVATLSIGNLRPDSDLILNTEYSQPTIAIDKYRHGTGWSASVVSALMSRANGLAYYDYNFPTASWQAGDIIRYSISGVTVTLAGQAIKLPSIQEWGVIGGVNKSSGTYSLPNDLVANILTTIDFTQNTKIEGIWLDLVNLVQNVTIRLSYQIDGATGRTFQTISWTTGDDDGVFIEGGFPVDDTVVISVQSAVVQGAAKDIPYKIFYKPY